MKQNARQDISLISVDQLIIMSEVSKNEPTN